MTEPSPADDNAELPPVRNWTLETDNRDIAWLGLRCAGSTNTLSRQVLLELDTVLDVLAAAPPSGLVVYSHKDNGFIAGADVNEFPLLENEEQAYQQVLAGQAIINKLEALPFTTVAALNGTTLGGGLELALACDWRLCFASELPSIGLPEVQLGVHPGLGGTLRATRLIGVREAMSLMLTGKPIRPAKAKAIGLVDRLTSAKSWRADAVDLALLKTNSQGAPLIDRILSLRPVRPWLARTLHKQVRAKARPEHYPAPGAVIELWHKHFGRPDALDAEARSFARLMFGPTARNLLRVFFLQDRLKDLAKQADIHFAHVHVIGAGTMGADIAAWCAIKGLSVTLQDREKRFVDAGIEKATVTMQKKLKKPTLVEEASARLVADPTGEGVRSADLIIEAIFEDLAAKQALFKDVELHARPDALLATNTSSIPLKQIASSLTIPSRLVGIHFFNPVALMPLVEIVHTPSTLNAVVDAANSFVRQIGKLPLPCRSTPGFLVNRILAPYLDEAFRLHEEGLAPEAIDRAAKDFGMPVGPLELADSVGLDILLHVAGVLGDTIKRPLPPGLESLVAEGRLGRKSGQGFYTWEDGKPRKAPSSNVEYASSVQQRLILSFLNEAAASIYDRVVADADLADAGTIFGAGFAPFRGGPLNYARQTGIETILEQLAMLQTEYGDRFKASSGWKLLQADNPPQA